MKKIVVVLAGVVLLAGCSEAKKDATASSAAGESAAASKPADGMTGVAECDDYLNKVMACIKDKVPESQRAAMEQAIQQSKASWASIQDKAALAQSCKAASEQAKATIPRWAANSDPRRWTTAHA
jgi:metal-dependent amidase/aminoacylase/carboxypeptidase family protein